jgi:hypothetical protein
MRTTVAAAAGAAINRTAAAAEAVGAAVEAELAKSPPQ